MSLLIRTLLLLPFFIVITEIVNSESIHREFVKLQPPMYHVQDEWVDSLINRLSLEEKIAQLFIVSVRFDEPDDLEQIIRRMQRKPVGGILIENGSPMQTVNLLNSIQGKQKVPLIVGANNEFIQCMCRDSASKYPTNLTMGGVRNEQFIYDFGVQKAEQLQQLGIHFHFSPCVGLSSYSGKPVQNEQFFGEDKRNVSRKAMAYMAGLQDNNRLPIARYFPGYGVAKSRSTQQWPVLTHSEIRLSEVALYPFKNLILNGLGAIQVGHTSVPAIEKDPNVPASLSSRIVDSLLKNELNYKGLVFSDALDKHELRNYLNADEIVVQALLAGNDVLCSPENVDKAIESIRMAVSENLISETLINEKCRKVLQLKSWLGLSLPVQIIDTAEIDLCKPAYEKLKSEIIEQSFTLLKNDDEILPFRDLADRNFLMLGFGSNYKALYAMFNRYAKTDSITIRNSEKLISVLDTLDAYTDIIICCNETGNGILNEQQNAIMAKRSKNTALHLCYMNNPYDLKRIEIIRDFTSVLVCYSDEAMVQEKCAQALFGGISVNGQLPVSINDDFVVGSGMEIGESVRLGYEKPEHVGLAEDVFYKIDSIAEDAIKMKATPGCQIVYVKNNKVLYNKCFGYHTYDKKVPVQEDHLYDLASITKVAATTLSLMKLYENQLLDVTTKLHNYLPEFKTKDKKSIRVNQVLTHHSGMRSWIPFYRNTLDADGNFYERIYRSEANDTFNLKVAENMFIRRDYPDSVFQAIIDTLSYRKKKYRYSDLGFYYLPKVIEQLSGESIDKYAKKQFYKPLGMRNTLYNPLNNFSEKAIVPSENDQIFRKQIIQGYVHDPGAAMLGGVSGHAGLFSTANDLAKLGQMLLNKGSYGGAIYLKPKTIEVFNKAYFKRKDNRRALGFDKPALKRGDPGPTCESASQLSFGHMGFTGTYFWVDPENQSVYIFLSNRTFPDQNNVKLIKNDIRTKIQQEFYNVFEH